MEKNCSHKFSSIIFILLLPCASVMIISVHVSNNLDASNLEAYDSPTSDVDSVMKKLIRIDRIRCRKWFEMVIKP